MTVRSQRQFKEPLNPHFGFYYSVNKTLYRGKTEYQKIELVDTEEFGRVLLLDNITQVVEKNDYQYHEPMVHPALSCHPNPRSVLVIGGGDGGILREVLKYPSIHSVVIVELDEQVVNFSRQYLPLISEGAFEDPRVTTVFCDGRSYVAQHPAQFDIIIMDMTDPSGPSRMLYTREFFRTVRAALRNDKGMFVMHSESPVSRPVAFNSIHHTLCSSFTHVNHLYTYIQMYAVLWSLSVCSAATDIASVKPRTIDARLERYGIKNLQHFNGATHQAMLTPYPYISSILKKRGKIITDTDPIFPDNFLQPSKRPPARKRSPVVG
jgi:spermidine synthase